jgi:CopG family nickel-responsive transcriptional regulator
VCNNDIKEYRVIPYLGDVVSMTRVERISFSTPPLLLKQFDACLKVLGYKDRSKALQIAMRNFVSEYSWKNGSGKQATGAILLTYNHESHGLQDALTDIQHHFRTIVNSTTHIHLDESRCLEIVSVKGRMERIQALAKELMKKRGVTQLKLSTVAV